MSCTLHWMLFPVLVSLLVKGYIVHGSLICLYQLAGHVTSTYHVSLAHLYHINLPGATLGGILYCTVYTLCHTLHQNVCYLS